MFENKHLEPTEISLEFLAKTNLSREVRLFVYMVMKDTLKINTKRAFRFQTIVDELYNNAIKHGSSSENSKIQIRIKLTEKFIEFAVSDQGKENKKIKAKNLSEQIIKKSKTSFQKKTSPSWRGLTIIITHWMDKVVFQDNPQGGITVLTRKSLKNINN